MMTEVKCQREEEQVEGEAEEDGEEEDNSMQIVNLFGNTTNLRFDIKNHLHYSLVNNDFRVMRRQETSLMILVMLVTLVILVALVVTIVMSAINVMNVMITETGMETEMKKERKERQTTK